MNSSQKQFDIPTNSGPSAAATWAFILALTPVVLVGLGYAGGWIYQKVFG